MNKENLIRIINELKEVRTETRTKVNDNILWDTSVRIYNSENIENQKKSKKEESKDVPATEPQKRLLKKLDYKGDFSFLTKLQAMKEIDSRIK